MIRRAPKDKENPYAQVNRKLLQDRSLSFQARGLLAYVLSKPRNWEARDHDLMKEGGIGEYALRSILRELKAQGYACRVRSRGARGKLDWDLEIYEEKQPVEAKAPLGGYPPVDDPQADNRVAAIDSTCAGARPTLDHKDQNTQAVCADSASPQSPGEGKEPVTEQTSSPTVPSSVTLNPSALAAVTMPAGFSVPTSRKISLAARPGAKRRDPKPIPVALMEIPPDIVERIGGDTQRNLTKGLDLDRGEFPLRVEAWRTSRRQKGRDKFSSIDTMLEDLRAYLINCTTGKRRAG